MFNMIDEFEKKVADYFGSPYAVAVDCCTHAIELCLRLQSIETTTCPSRTYLSVPMTLKKLNINWNWRDEDWYDYYYLGNTNIIDAAVFWKELGYVSGTMMCLSFQFRKHLSLGRGGMILLDNKLDYTTLVKMSYDGRDRHVPWAQQNIDTLGYHYYMTPETAQLGLDRFEKAAMTTPKSWNYSDYPDISKLKIFER
jgi:dTDP-4-amino-4,6-dideoxygalactose transaminase